MISPDVRLDRTASHEIQEDKRNGHGTWMFLPEDGADLPDTLPYIGEVGDFTEVHDIAQLLAQNGSILVAGAPGSGKSHLIRDIQTAAVVYNIPTFCLSMHVNAGSRQGPENARAKLEEFREATQETGGLVILDNVDIVGYRGSKGKNKGRKVAYAQGMQPLIESLVDDPSLYVLGTAHDDAWREGQWTWQDEAIDGPANAILESFKERFTFDGKMALIGLAHILRQRNLDRSDGQVSVSLGTAAQVIRLLHDTGKANFFHANHLPVDLFLQDPELAISKIEAGRNQRRGQA